MDLELKKKNGAKYRLSSLGLVYDFVVEPVQVEAYTERVEGRAGTVDYGADYSARRITVPMKFKSEDLLDYALLRDELYGMVIDSHPYYIREMRRKKTMKYDFVNFGEAPKWDPQTDNEYVNGKQYYVRLVSAGEPEQVAAGGEITLEFETVGTPFAESIATTQDIQLPDYAEELGPNENLVEVANDDWYSWLSSVDLSTARVSGEDYVYMNIDNDAAPGTNPRIRSSYDYNFKKGQTYTVSWTGFNSFFIDDGAYGGIYINGVINEGFGDASKEKIDTVVYDDEVMDLYRYTYTFNFTGEDSDNCAIFIGGSVIDGVGIEMEGRNLLLNSGDPSALTFLTNNSDTAPAEFGVENGIDWMTGTDSSTGNFYLATYVNPTFDNQYGETYSEAFNGYEGVITYSVDVMSKEPLEINLSGGEPVILEPNEWQRIYVVNDSKGTRVSGIRASENPDIPVGTKVYWRNYQIEQGNTPTDWSPAPEDNKDNFIMFNDLKLEEGGEYTGFRDPNADAHGISFQAEDWSFGMGLDVDASTHQYSHLAQSGQPFEVYNAGNVQIHPFEQYLVIDITDVEGSSSYFEIQNKTNGSNFRVTERVTRSQKIKIDGANVEINDLAALRRTNKQYIQLSPGSNMLTIHGAGSARIHFDFKFYYL